MKFEKALIFLLAGLPLVVSAQEIPQEVRQEILAKYPSLDEDGDGKLSIREFRKRRKSLSKEDRAKIQQSVADQLADIRKKEINSLLGSMGLRGERGIKYKDSTQGRTLLDIIYPKNEVYEKAPLFIFIHGGGYHGVSRELLYAPEWLPIIKHATDNGMAVATIGYSLVGKSEDLRMMHLNRDVKDALRFLAQNSDRFGIDPHKFITLGQSAGGSLALIASLTPPDHLPGTVSGPGADYSVIGCINFFGATTFLEPSVLDHRVVNQGRQNSWFALNEGLDTEQTMIDCSPDKHLRDDSPPILMFSGEKDHKVPAAHGRYLKRLAEEVGADVILYEIRNAGHGIKSADGSELSMNWEEFVEITLESIAKWVGD